LIRESSGRRGLKMSKALCATQVKKQSCRVFITLLVSLATAHGQTAHEQRYEITPLFGGMFGGTWDLEQQGVPNFDAHKADGFSFGVAGGFRFDDSLGDCRACNLIEFRWLRQNTHLELKQNPLLPTPVTFPTFHPAVTLNYFLSDFTHEWTLEEAKMIKPFLTASLGAALASTPASSATRFVFGIGTGVKIFPKRHWGIRLQVEYLPIVMHAELQRVFCTVGCVVVLNGGVMNQFQLTAGPAFRF
jgi:hypothetical protein